MHLCFMIVQGIRYAYGVSVFQMLNIVLIDIAYTITAAKAMVTLANTACGWQGIDSGDCFNTVRMRHMCWHLVGCA